VVIALLLKGFGLKRIAENCPKITAGSEKEVSWHIVQSHCNRMKSMILPCGFAAFQDVFRIFVATDVASAVSQVYAK
jgi:hypothetical protein